MWFNFFIGVRERGRWLNNQCSCIQCSNPILDTNWSQTVYIPNKLPDENGNLQDVKEGDNAWINTIILIQINCSSTYAYMDKISSYINLKQSGMTVNRLQANGTFQDIAQSLPSVSNIQFKGGFLIGYASGNDNVLYDNGDVEAASNKHCMDMFTSSYSY